MHDLDRRRSRTTHRRGGLGRRGGERFGEGADAMPLQCRREAQRVAQVGRLPRTNLKGP